MKRFLPLIGMFVLVLLWTAFSQRAGFDLHQAMAQFMGAYFVLFGALKVLNWSAFVEAYRAYDDIAKRSKTYAFVYPFIELGLGFLFVTGTALVFANVVTLVLMSQKAFSVHKKLQKGVCSKCACLGGFFDIPITRVTFFEDLLMAVMALLMLLFGHI